GDSYVVDDATELIMARSKHVSFAPSDVVVALSAGEKGDGFVPSSVVDEEGDSYVVDDATELIVARSKHVSFSPSDVVVALSAGEKGDGFVPSSVVDEERILSHATRPKLNGLPPRTFSIACQASVGLTPTNDLLENLTKTVALPNPTKHTFLNLTINLEPHLTQGTKPQFKTAGLLFRMFKVDRTEFRGTMQGEQLQLKIRKFKTELAMQILVDRLTRLMMMWMRHQYKIWHSEDHVFQIDQCDAFDSNVDEAPIAQTMFITKLSSANPIYDEAGPSYDSDILSEVQDHDNHLDSVDEYQEVHEMHNGNKVVNESLTAELARYKEQVEIYKKGQVKTNQAPAVMHDLDDTLEMAEITRKKMLEKMKSPLWIDGITATPLVLGLTLLEASHLMNEILYVLSSASHFANRPSFLESFSISSIGPSVANLTLCFQKVVLRDLVVCISSYTIFSIGV
nr:hypothetical protein [Tanacetum cinerariifolium]